MRYSALPLVGLLISLGRPISNYSNIAKGHHKSVAHLIDRKISEDILSTGIMILTVVLRY